MLIFSGGFLLVHSQLEEEQAPFSPPTLLVTQTPLEAFLSSYSDPAVLLPRTAEDASQQLNRLVTVDTSRVDGEQQIIMSSEDAEQLGETFRTSNQEIQVFDNTVGLQEETTALLLRRGGRETDKETETKDRNRVGQTVRKKDVSKLLFDATYVLQRMMEHSIQFAQKLFRNYGTLTRLMQRVENNLEPRESNNVPEEFMDDSREREGNSEERDEKQIEWIENIDESIACKRSSDYCNVDSDCCYASSYDKHRLKCDNRRCCRPSGTHCNSSYECCGSMACVIPKIIGGGGILVRMCVPRTSSTWH